MKTFEFKFVFALFTVVCLLCTVGLAEEYSNNRFQLNLFGFRMVTTKGRGNLVFQKEPRGIFMSNHQFKDGDIIYVNEVWQKDGYGIAYDKGEYGYVDASYVDWNSILDTQVMEGNDINDRLDLEHDEIALINVQPSGEDGNKDIIQEYREQLINANWIDNNDLEENNDDIWYEAWNEVLNGERGYQGRFAVFDANLDGKLEVYVEYHTIKAPADAVWGLMYEDNGLKVYKNSSSREILTAINPKKGRLLFDRTRGKGYHTVHKFDTSKGIEEEYTWFPFYIYEEGGEEELDKIEKEYYADTFAPRIVELNDSNIKKYLSGSGRSTQYQSWGEAYLEFLLGDAKEIDDYGDHYIGTEEHVFNINEYEYASRLKDVSFAFVDINDDNIPELLVYDQKNNERDYFGIEEQPQNVCVYTYEDGHIAHRWHIGLSGGGDIREQNFSVSEDSAYPGVFCWRVYDSDVIEMYYSIDKGELISKMVYKSKLVKDSETGDYHMEDIIKTDNSELYDSSFKTTPIVFYSLTDHWGDD